MSPLESDEVRQLYGGSGQFTSVKKLLKPGEKKRVQLLDINKNYSTKYPMKDKDYGYRVSLKTEEGEALILDCNSRDLVRQLNTALYPNGPDKEMVACWVTFHRRTERKSTQSELEVIREEGGGDVPF